MSYTDTQSGLNSHFVAPSSLPLLNPSALLFRAAVPTVKLLFHRSSTFRPSSFPDPCVPVHIRIALRPRRMCFCGQSDPFSTTPFPTTFLLPESLWLSSHSTLRSQCNEIYQCRRGRVPETKGVIRILRLLVLSAPIPSPSEHAQPVEQRREKTAVHDCAKSPR